MVFDVPDTWTVRPLNQVAKVTIGLVTTMTKHYSEVGVPLIRNSDIKENRVTEEKLIFLSHEFANDHSTRKLISGDIVTVHTGNVGVSSVINSRLDGCLGFATLNTRTKQHIVDPYFLCWFFNSHEFINHCVSLSTGDGRQNLNLKDFVKVTIPIPPLLEQRKIAKILQTWDRAIATTKKLIDASKQQKKALMQQLLTGKKRFAGFEGEWEEVPLKRMGNIISGGTPDTTKQEYWNGDILWLTPTDVTKLRDRYVVNTARKVTSLGVSNSSATILPEGCLMVCTRATIGELAISTSEISTNQGFKNIVPNDKFEVEFIYYGLSNNKKELRRRAAGSTFLELSKKDFEKVALLCPGVKEQKKVARILANTDSEISALEMKVASLKQEKKALMQQLLTGKRRVKVDD